MTATNTSQTARKLHGWHHDDYEEARDQIFRQIGDISEHDLFSNRVMVAVYIRPDRRPLPPSPARPEGGFWYHTAKEQREDIYQGTVVMVLKCGCNAFTGDDGFLKAEWNGNPPKCGDWVFLEAQQGSPFSVVGEGAEELMGVDLGGNPVSLFEWGKGWPVRVVRDQDIMGRVAKPHQLVG